MSSSFLRSTYRRMMKYFLRHWCMEIKYSGNNKTSVSTKKTGQDGCQKSDEHDKQNSSIEKKIDQTMKVRLDEDGILFDAQLEWEHEEGIEHSPKLYRKSTEDLLNNLLTQSPCSTSTPYSPDFEWDHLFDFTL